MNNSKVMAIHGKKNTRGFQCNPLVFFSYYSVFPPMFSFAQASYWGRKIKNDVLPVLPTFKIVANGKVPFLIKSDSVFLCIGQPLERISASTSSRVILAFVWCISCTFVRKKNGHSFCHITDVQFNTQNRDLTSLELCHIDAAIPKPSRGQSALFSKVSLLLAGFPNLFLQKFSIYHWFFVLSYIIVHTVQGITGCRLRYPLVPVPQPVPRSTSLFSNGRCFPSFGAFDAPDNGYYSRIF